MRTGALFTVIFMLTGCIGFLDKMTPHIATSAFVKNNDICAVSIMKPGEKMVSVEIHSSDERTRFEVFPDKPRYIPAGGCLPVFSTTFNAGEKYAFYWNVVPVKGDAYLITTRFTLAADAQGNLTLAP
ncbi:hypothetical protein Q5705_13550 [Kosakonia sp. H02]|nr:hypothetical protein Q5705_13550 [Kosakonia sp. H02]